MQCLRNLSAEFVSLNRLSIPAIIANAVDASFNITTIIILGHLGKGHLSAGVIALAMYNICWIFLEGMLTAQDNLVSKAFALKDRKLARYWSYIAGGVTFASLIPTTVLFVFGAVIVQYAFFIRPHTASKAAFFLILLLPGYCCHAMYRVLQKYLQCQRQLKMSLVCGLLGITTNIICGYVLSFTMGFGFSGCGIAVTTARAAMLLAMSSSVLKVVDMSSVVEEVTHLGKSIRKRYLDAADARNRSVEANMDGIAASSGGTGRRIKSAQTAAGASKKTHKGRGKVRIAPIGDSELSHGGSIASPDGGLEMVSLARDTAGVALEEGRQLGAVEESPLHEERNFITETDVGSQVLPTAGEAQEEDREEDDEEGYVNEVDDDAVGLIDRSEAKQLRRTGKAVAADTLRFLLLGIPGGLMLGMEFWTFEVITVIIAHMGSIVVGTNQILLITTNFFFLSLPFAVSVAATVQISKQLAKKRPRRARMVAWLCLVEGSLLMALAAGVLYLLRDHTGYIFTSNEDTIFRLKKMAPFNAGFQVAYGIYGSAQGVLRATSHQFEIFGWTFAAIWLVGMPIGLYLAFWTRPTYDLRGIWIGLIVGMGLLAGALVLQVAMLDWDKEARKAEFRLLQASGGRPDLEEDAGPMHVVDPLRAGEADDEPGIVMNPLGNRTRAGRASGLRGVETGAAMPAIGSRAVGGFSMEQLFRTGEDELAELEFVEFGSLSTPATHSTGRGYRNKAGDGTALGQAAALELESAPGEDDELYKRVD